MLDRYLNPTPTPYKWDRFSVGFFPALLLPIAGFLIIFGFTYFYSTVVQHASYSFELFKISMRYSGTFLRVSTLSCFLNPIYFYLLLQRNYYNACRGIVLASMLIVFAILIKEVI